jgi:hypothetical protein
VHVCVRVCVYACLHIPALTVTCARTRARTHTGTSLARASGLPCLLNKLSNVNEETCPYRIEGVSGGTVLYDEQLTGVPRTRDGRTNVNLYPSIYVYICLCVLHR